MEHYSNNTCKLIPQKGTIYEKKKEYLKAFVTVYKTE